MKRIFYLILLVIFVTPIKAQWSAAVQTSIEFNDNMFQLPEKEKSIGNSFLFGIEHTKNNFSIGYYGNYNSFSDFSERNFYWQQFGAWYSDTSYIVGAYISNRINKLDYDYFDYTAGTIYGRRQFGLGDFNLLTSLSLNYSSYSVLSEYNNFSVQSYLGLSKSFNTKTTFLGMIKCNYKNYKEEFSTTTESISPSLLQLGFSGRIAQGIFDNTGLAFQYNYRNVVEGDGKEIRVNEYSYGDESDLFDDPLTVNGYDASIELTQIISDDFILGLSYYYYDEEFSTQGIYLDAENYNYDIKRKDKKSIVSLELSKSFQPFAKENYYLTLGLNYNYINSESNSYWFNFKASSLSFDVSLQF